MQFFQSLWEWILEKYNECTSSQKNRIARLRELERENEERKGHIQNPLSLISRNREIGQLKRQIKTYRSKFIAVCGVISLSIVFLFCFISSSIESHNRTRNYMRALAVSSSAASTIAPTPSYTPLPTSTPVVTPSPTPTTTPSPTPTPTITPSPTPVPTPTITPTPVPTATATPTISPQPIEVESSISSSSSTNSPQTVTPSTNYVYISENGKKYHRRPGCSNMENPMEVTVEQAIAWGYTPCKKCY